jgi:hypothetical protein
MNNPLVIKQVQAPGVLMMVRKPNGTQIYQYSILSIEFLPFSPDSNTRDTKLKPHSVTITQTES